MSEDLKCWYSEKFHCEEAPIVTACFRYSRTEYFLCEEHMLWNINRHDVYYLKFFDRYKEILLTLDNLIPGDVNIWDGEK